jgi:hypothetical protein
MKVVSYAHHLVISAMRVLLASISAPFHSLHNERIASHIHHSFTSLDIIQNVHHFILLYFGTTLDDG